MDPFNNKNLNILMEDYNSYYDERINSQYFDQDVDMSLNTVPNPEIHMDLEPIIENIGNLNLSEQAHHINPSTNIVQINEDENNKEEEPTNPDQTGNDIENINNLDLLIPNYGGGEEKLNFYPELAKVESNKTISSHHYTENITSELTGLNSEPTQVIELDENTAAATKNKDSH